VNAKPKKGGAEMFMLGCCVKTSVEGPWDVEKLNFHKFRMFGWLKHQYLLRA
jgi:hypothetical protein